MEQQLKIFAESLQGKLEELERLGNSEKLKEEVLELQMEKERLKKQIGKETLVLQEKEQEKKEDERRRNASQKQKEKEGSLAKKTTIEVPLNLGNNKSLNVTLRHLPSENERDLGCSGPNSTKDSHSHQNPTAMASQIQGISRNGAVSFLKKGRNSSKNSRGVSDANQMQLSIGGGGHQASGNFDTMNNSELNNTVALLNNTVMTGQRSKRKETEGKKPNKSESNPPKKLLNAFVSLPNENGKKQGAMLLNTNTNLLNASLLNTTVNSNNGLRGGHSLNKRGIAKEGDHEESRARPKASRRKSGELSIFLKENDKENCNKQNGAKPESASHKRQATADFRNKTSLSRDQSIKEAQNGFKAKKKPSDLHNKSLAIALPGNPFSFLDSRPPTANHSVKNQTTKAKIEEERSEKVFKRKSQRKSDLIGSESSKINEKSQIEGRFPSNKATKEKKDTVHSSKSRDKSQGNEKQKKKSLQNLNQSITNPNPQSSKGSQSIHQSFAHY